MSRLLSATFLSRFRLTGSSCATEDGSGSASPLRPRGWRPAVEQTAPVWITQIRTLQPLPWQYENSISSKEVGAQHAAPASLAGAIGAKVTPEFPAGSSDIPARSQAPRESRDRQLGG